MNWLKYKKVYFTLSGVLLLVSVVSLLMWKLNLGIDFTGGSLIEYRFSEDVPISKIQENVSLENIDLEFEVVSKRQIAIRSTPLSEENKSRLDEQLKIIDQGLVELKYEIVGPAIGPELVQKTIYALLISAGVILVWVAYQFKNIKYGLSAVLAMLHDSIILLGAFSLMGHFWSVEIDFLFVTAMLTILSFSVHDTIVVFDRIREVSKKSSDTLSNVSDIAVTQTMVRSLNNSFTIIFMLVSLVLLGGETIRWFAVALLIGTISGTYSSPFVAVPLLATLYEIRSIKAEKIR